MNEISEAIQAKCLAFGDRIIKLNEYLPDFKSKSFIALKEARESLYWIDLLHRNSYLDDKQYHSIYSDCVELVRILVARCKTLNQETIKGNVKCEEMETW